VRVVHNEELCSDTSSERTLYIISNTILRADRDSALRKIEIKSAPGTDLYRPTYNRHPNRKCNRYNLDTISIHPLPQFVKQKIYKTNHEKIPK